MAWNINGNASTNPASDFLGTTDLQPIVVRTNSKEALRVDQAGKVGIGTPNPQNLLHVGPGSSPIVSTRVNAVVASNGPDGGIAIAQNSGVSLLVQASGAGAYIGTTSTHPLVLRTGDLDRVVVDPAGNTGFGQGHPQNLIHVGLGSTSILQSRVNAVVTSNAPDAGIAIAQNSGVNLLVQASGAGAFIGTTSNHPVVFRTVDQDRVVILNTGDVMMSGNLSVAKDVILTGGDCAEHFDVLPDAVCEPGTVMAISIGGALDESTKAYDKRVAGVVSGAGRFRPAILLDRQPHEERPPIALAGKVYCKVDAQYGPIEIGDLLTSSDTPGHAMKAADPAKAFGSVIGKALGPQDQGCGMIPILVTLQ